MRLYSRSTMRLNSARSAPAIGFPFGKQRRAVRHRRPGRIDAGRFQRLEVSRSEPDGNAILRPSSACAAPRPEAQHPRLGHRPRLEIASERSRPPRPRPRCTRSKDIAVTDPVLERDPPAPARLHRAVPRVYGLIGPGAAFARHRPGPVALQPGDQSSHSALEARLRSATPGSPSNRRTDPPRSDPRFRAEHDRRRSLRLPRLDRNDGSLGPHHAPRLGEPARDLRDKGSHRNDRRNQ